MRWWYFAGVSGVSSLEVLLDIERQCISIGGAMQKYE